MKRFLHILFAVFSVCMAIGALDLTGVIALVPDDVAKALTVTPPILLSIGHTLLAIGDRLDDGEANGSFPGSLKLHPLAMLAALAMACLALTQCSVSTAPDGTQTSTVDQEAVAQGSVIGLALLDRLIDAFRTDAPTTTPAATK